MNTYLQSAILAPAIFLVAAASAGAATIAYTNDFSGTGDNTALPNEVTDARWEVTGGVYRNSHSAIGGTASSASIPITNAAGVPFTMDSQFTVTSFGTIKEGNFANTVGFGAFGLNANFTGTTTSNAYYLADFAYQRGQITGSDGVLRILSLGDTSGFVSVNGLADANPGSGNLAVTLNTTYTLRLQGSYTGSTLNLTFGLFNAAGTTQIGTSATATDTTPLTGTNFGYRNRTDNTAGTTTADFDNLRIIPEPTSTVLLGLGLAALILRRRR